MDEKEGNPCHRRTTWYRKHNRDQNFRREQSSDSDSDTSGSRQRSPHRRLDINEHSNEETDSNKSEPVIPDDDAVDTENTSSNHESVASDSIVSNGGNFEPIFSDQHEQSDLSSDNQDSLASDGSQAVHNPPVFDNQEEENGVHSDDGADQGNNAHQIFGGNELNEQEQDSDVVMGDNSGQSSSEVAQSDQDSSSADEGSSADEDSSAHEDDEGDEEFNYNNEPIFNGAAITLQESALAIVTFVLSHKLSGMCISDLLALLSLHCGPENILLNSLYKFRKYFEVIGTEYIKLHYFCSICQNPLQSKDSVCHGSQHRDSYFIEFPLMNQLQNLFGRTAFYEKLQYRFQRGKKGADYLEDIYDGYIYKQLFESGFLSNPHNISFFMYFDGVSIFKSSNFSIWPVYLTINELKYTDRTRKENTLLAGLWFGKKKPNPNLFLSPIHDSLSSLETNGIDITLQNGEKIKVKSKLLGAVGDMPAKSLFMRFMQYNGAYSCFNCMAQGGRYDLGNATIQVFPYSRHLQLRHHNETIGFAELALEARENDPDASVYGIKGPSLLSSMLPDLIHCMGIDIMHLTFLGGMRTILHLWFDTQYNQEPFSVSNLVQVVDARLQQIKPPSSFQNNPRTIKIDIAHWKAFDLKVFFFYYSLVVLEGILPAEYWFHHAKLVTAISLLCHESISPTDIENAEELLHLYVSDFQRLYGLRYMTLTFHQLLHLPFVCKNLGPAWVFSCFFYESLNGQLARLVHGSRYVALQVCSSSAVFMKSAVLVNTMQEGEAKRMCLRFQSKSAQKVKVTENIDEKTGVVGKLTECYPVPIILSRLLRDDFDIVGGRYKSFLRLKKKGLVYTSDAYVRSKQKKSCYVEIFHQNTSYLCKVDSFYRWSNCGNNCPGDCEQCEKKYFCLVSLFERDLWELHDAPNVTLTYLHKITDMNKKRVFLVESIRSIGIYMPVNNREYLAVPVNNLEVE